MNEKNQKDIKNVIEIKNVKKDYKMYKNKKARLLEALFPFYHNHETFSAINNLNLEIHKGEVLGILGKNGAGKSTLLKMITGVVTPTSGELKVNGKISSLLELGAAFNPELTGEENIYQHGQVMGLTNEQIEETKQDIIDFADIGDHLYQPVKTYSSGMFARLAFACAINVDPDILIVDEVLSVGDMAFQLKCFKKFQQFKEKGKTILYVTHNVADVLENCNRAIILSAGKKIYDGDVKEGVEQYKKLITGMLDKKKTNENLSENVEGKWKGKLEVNPNIIEYGHGKADLIDFGIFDLNDKIITSIENDKDVVLKTKIVFNEDVKDPIFTMTVKNFKGLDMMGTNTLQERIVTGDFKKGDVVIVEFKQKLKLAPNKYTLSFSCTHFTPNGELEVLSRKYDALLVEITSNKNCVGFYRLDSKIKIKNIGG